MWTQIYILAFLAVAASVQLFYEPKQDTMKINIQSVHFDADKKLLDFIENKLGKLSSHYDSIIESEVTLRLDKATNNENKIAEVRLNVRGNDLFAKKQCKTFEEATDLCAEALKTQLEKHKEKTRQL